MAATGFAASCHKGEGLPRAVPALRRRSLLPPCPGCCWGPAVRPYTLAQEKAPGRAGSCCSSAPSRQDVWMHGSAAFLSPFLAPPAATQLLADHGHKASPPHPLGQDAADRRFRHVSILRAPSVPVLPFPAPARGPPATPLLLGRSETLLHGMLLPAPGTFLGAVAVVVAAQSLSHLLILLRARRRAADLTITPRRVLEIKQRESRRRSVYKPCSGAVIKYRCGFP